MDTRETRTWAEVDLSALTHNYRLLRGLLAPDCGFVGLCKADGYGHGGLAVARTLEELGAELLAVASVEEAIQLREGGITLPILCLGVTPPALSPLLWEYRVTQTVESLEQGLALSRLGQERGTPLPVHLKVDTGMGRLGIYWDSARPEEGAELLAQLCGLPGLAVEGVFSHFANADGDPAYTQIQFKKFLAVREALSRRGISIPRYHCAASAATLHHPETHLDLVRPGLALYGYDPGGGTQTFDLRPVLGVYSRISTVRSLPAGTAVSYGCTAVLERDSRLAVVPMGYGDGLPRCLSNRMEVWVNGVPCPIVGRICMDMCMIDVTHLSQVSAGDVVQIYGGPLLEQAAQLAGTIPYELMCRLSPRVPRIYIRQE